MEILIREALWNQLGASIGMLGNVIASGPGVYEGENRKFFYIAYHCLVLSDYYLTIPPAGFSPFLPFTIKDPEDVPEGVLGDMVPDRVYNREELLAYLEKIRTKCYAVISGLTMEKLNGRFAEAFEDEGAMDYSIPEILLYNMRHIQHHVGQLNLLLRQQVAHAPGWVFRSTDLL